MIDPDAIVAQLADAGISFVTGVPDSLLKEACAAISGGLPPERHVIAANEGAAVGLAMGHFLASGRPALVYLQNSGLGNAVNPLVSLAAPEVYGIPMVLMVGWRGEIAEGGVQLADEPQHRVQGRVTPGQLDLLGIPYRLVDAGSDFGACLREAVADALARSTPVALLVRAKAFSRSAAMDAGRDPGTVAREDAIRALVEALPGDVPVVATTGHTSREIFELRRSLGAGHHRDFLTVGGMGHAVSIAGGIALTRPELTVVCLDGDGALLMHTGALTNAARLPNLVHVVLNNGAHDSVGGQPTMARHLRLPDLARSLGYAHVHEASSLEEIRGLVPRLLAERGSRFLEIRCRRGARADLGRPDRTPEENRNDFMAFLRGE